MAQYEQECKDVDADSDSARRVHEEEKAIEAETETKVAESKSSFWVKMQERSTSFADHFKAAQEAARHRVVEAKLEEIEKVSDAADKEAQEQALHLAELLTEAKEHEAAAESQDAEVVQLKKIYDCLLYTSPSPRDS